MTFRLVLILTVLGRVASGQLLTVDKSVLEVVKIALETKKLPNALINNVDSIRAIRVKETYDNTERYYLLTVGIEATKENGLKTHEHINWGKVEIWIWFFVTDIYWLTPSKIVTKEKKVSFDFKTNSWGDKKIKYYKGRLTAERTSEEWTIKKFKLVETENSFDSWKRLKNDNAR